MSKRTIPASFEIGANEELVVTTNKRSPWIVPFKPFGATNPRLPESIDAVSYIAEFSKAELFLFQEVMCHKHNNNDVRIRKKAYATDAQAKLKKAIPIWKRKGLLIQYKREHYMINPWFVVPQQKELHLETINRWKKLKANQTR